jgi:AraC-like DNA-binding protein
MQNVIPRKELHRIIKQFLKDYDRGISIQLFADLCGLNISTLQEVFIEDKLPLSEYVQRRVSKGYQSWLKGEVRVMMNQDRTRFVDYRREAKPTI